MNSKKSLQSTKTPNYSRIFRFIYQQGKISKQEIAANLDLSLPTVSQNLQRLQKNKLITTDGKFESSIGRRATAYSVAARSKVSLGLEVFAKQANLSALDLNGQEIATDTLKIQYQNSDVYFKKLCDWILAFSTHHKISTARILHLGIGVQGLISHDGQKVLYGKILASTGLTTEVFSRHLPYPVSFYHDADCVAVAEQFLTHSDQDTTYLSIGEHLGTAMMINNRIYSGENGRSGTMEHITLNTHSDRQCYCGRYGCIETYCSISSLLNADENLDDFMAQLAAGDLSITQRWNDYLNHLAEAINNLHMFLDNRLVIAGELIRHLDQSIIEELDKRIRKITAFPEDHSYLELGIVTARPVAIGAAIPSVTEFVESI